MPAGRPPAGPQHARKLDGSSTAKERLEVILETLAGKTKIDAACERLSISPARFFLIRDQALGAALGRLEPQRSGRKPKLVTPEQARIEALERELERLKQELALAETRVKTSLLLTRVGESTRASGPKKKLQRTRSKRRRGRSPR